jgi:hypothetical protein
MYVYIFYVCHFGLLTCKFGRTLSLPQPVGVASRLRLRPLQRRPQGSDHPSPHRRQPHLARGHDLCRRAEYLLPRTQPKELCLRREYDLGRPLLSLSLSNCFFAIFFCPVTLSSIHDVVYISIHIFFYHGYHVQRRE